MKIWHEVWDYVKMIIIVVAIVLVINNVVLINAKIPSPSMEKTIMTGDRIFGFRLASVSYTHLRWLFISRGHYSWRR